MCITVKRIFFGNLILEASKTIEGLGADKAIRVEPSLIERYGGTAGQCKKRAGKIQSDKYISDVYWYELDGKQYEMKLKTRKGVQE